MVCLIVVIFLVCWVIRILWFVWLLKPKGKYKKILSLILLFSYYSLLGRAFALKLFVRMPMKVLKSCGIPPSNWLNATESCWRDDVGSPTACNPLPLAETQRVVPGTQYSMWNKFKLINLLRIFVGICFLLILYWFWLKN